MPLDSDIAMSSSPENGDQQGLLAHQSSPPQMASDSDLSTSHHVKNEEASSSELDFQKLLSSRQLQPGRTAQGTGGHRCGSSVQENQDRVNELRAQMEESQRQIQQLHQAQQAVRDAVDGMTTTQELLHVAPTETKQSAGESNGSVSRNASHRSGNSTWSQMQDESKRPEEPFHQPPNAKFQPPIDDEYYRLNPWYGQAPKRPVFGLGGPLPHTVRPGLNTAQSQSVKQRDPEMGESQPKMSEKNAPYSLGAPLPHRTGSQPVSQHKPTHSLGKDLPHPENRKQDRAPRRKPQRKATVESPEETQARERREAQLPYENQAAANPTGTEGRAPLDGDGRPQKNFDPFASFDRIGRSFDGEDEDPDNTEWAIDAEPIGRSEKGEAETGEKDPNELRNWWARIRAKHPEPLAEFLCTTISIFLGMCATLQVNLAGGEYGDYETSCWGWGIAFMLGIYVGGGVSGAHMNPAISLSLWLFRGFPPKQMLIYWVCQLLGCIVAAALAYAIFHDTIHYVDPGLVDTATSFYSKPQSFVSPTTAFFTQFVAAAIMMTSTLALGDDQNNPPGAGLHAFIMGLLVTAQKMTLGYNTGVALNPASDFGPRLVCLMVGYNTNMFTEWGLWWLWGPWASTIAGSVVGCSVYDSLVFVGSESPVNYRLPEKWRRRLKRAAPKKEGGGINGWGE